MMTMNGERRLCADLMHANDGEEVIDLLQCDLICKIFAISCWNHLGTQLKLAAKGRDNMLDSLLILDQAIQEI